MCSIFTKVMRPLVAHWRAQGLKVVLYLDDGIITHANSGVLAEQGRTVQQDLHHAGFVVNDSKSRWQPVQVLTWLGFEIDARNLVYNLHSTNVNRIGS